MTEAPADTSETLMTAAIASRYYYGTTAILRAGDRLAPDPGRVLLTTDPAQALVEAWRMAARAQGGVPHVYELSLDESQLLVVVSDVMITGALAWRADEIMRAT